MELREFTNLVHQMQRARAPAPTAVYSSGSRWSDAELREVFFRYDDNRSGKLDYKELQQVLGDLGLASDSAEATRLLQSFDRNNDGLLSLGEFSRLMRQVAHDSNGASSAAAIMARDAARGGVWAAGANAPAASARARGWASEVMAKATPSFLQEPKEGFLPPGWVEATDPATGRVYFFHEATRETRWTRPVEHSAVEATLAPPPPPPRTPPRKKGLFSRRAPKEPPPRGRADNGQWSDDDPRHIANIIDAFGRYDRNNSNRLDYRELRPALLDLGMVVDDREAIAILRSYDENGDGVLSLDEFSTLVRQLAPRSSRRTVGGLGLGGAMAV